MRAGLSTIQQTLTPDSAAVLNRSIAEAARRSHGQTTPLHVAATLLAAPSGGLLRQACVRSHPTSSHPLQCRALELCFSVALDRLPSVSGGGAAEPPISNALMAALKRAQAHQRRGCPEQQQQPLLAVKVELEQLVVSILDDPSVSRVMREASFSSPAVKATIEQSLASSSSSPSPSPSILTVAAASPSPSTSSSSLGIGSLGLSPRTPASRNLYMNPRLHQQQVASAAGGGVASRTDEVKRVLDIMARPKKRNPVLVADADPASVMREVLQRIQTGDAPQPIRSAQVISLEKELVAMTDRSEIPARIREMGSSVDDRIADGGGVVLDLGDLKWLVESPGGGGVGASSRLGSAPIQHQKIVTESGRAAVAEMAKLLGRLGDGGGRNGSRVWIVGTATCATYLRCQVYHPTMENDWDLQAVPIPPRSPHPGMFQRLGGNGILSSSIESLNPTKGSPALAATQSPLRQSPPGCSSSTLCPECMQNYERELAKLVAEEFDKSSSESKPEARQSLPHWLQIAKPGCAKPAADHFKSKEQEFKWKQSTEMLLARWRETCSQLHPKPHPMLIRPHSASLPIAPVSNSGSNSSKFGSCPPFQSKLTLTQSVGSVQLSSRRDELLRLAPPRPATPPSGSPVKTDLVLGRPKLLDSTMEKAHIERVKDCTGCTQDDLSDKQRDKTSGIADFDSFKRLFKGLAEKVGWQAEAASTVAAAVMQCRSGNGKPRGAGPKGDTWLLFAGPDKVGKRKMAAALSELMFGAGPTVVHLSGRPSANADCGESDRISSRGRTSVDRIVEAIRSNPFSVLLLEDIDQADMLTRGCIKRAIDKGRIADSQGREVSLGSAVFVLTADWLPEEMKSSHDSGIEERILNSANGEWQLELSVGDRTGKRRAEKICDEDRLPATKPRKEYSLGGASLSLDLNLAAGMEEDANEGSRNSSDLTVEHEPEPVRLAISCMVPSSSQTTELMESVDEAVVFKPVDFAPMRRKVLETVSSKFTSIMGNGNFILVDEGALDRMVGGAWLAGAAAGVTGGGGFDDWIDRVLVPTMQQLKTNIRAGDGKTLVRLSAVKGGGRGRQAAGDWLPQTVGIALGAK